MKPISYLLLVILAGLLSCNELHPLTPPNPIIGGWTVGRFEISDLPQTYIVKYHVDSIVKSPTYTIYKDVRLLITQNVNTYSFTSNGSYSEEYILNGGIPRLEKYQIDTGSWSLVDSTLTLTIANGHPHKLTYLPATHELTTDKFRQTAILEDEVTYDRDTVSYTIKVYYDRNL